MSDSDKPGYKNPPKASQFKKGRSGNPRGRPKGIPNHGFIVTAFLSKKVTVRDKNGRIRKVTLFEAFTQQFMAKMLNGSLPEQIKIMQLLLKQPPQVFRDASPPITVVVDFGEPEKTETGET